MEFPGEDVIPNLSWEDGKLSIDSEATAAINALPACPVADKLEKYELQYRLWRYSGTGGVNSPLIEKRWSRFVLWLSWDLFRILRAQIGELARAHAKTLASTRAAETQAGFYKDYIRLVDENKKLRAFLFEQFETELKNADSMNTPLLEVAKKIMMRTKPEWDMANSPWKGEPK